MSQWRKSRLQNSLNKNIERKTLYVYIYNPYIPAKVGLVVQQQQSATCRPREKRYRTLCSTSLLHFIKITNIKYLYTTFFSVSTLYLVFFFAFFPCLFKVYVFTGLVPFTNDYLFASADVHFVVIDDTACL